MPKNWKWHKMQTFELRLIIVSIQRDICIFISLSFATIQYEWVLKVNSFDIQESGKRKSSELRIYVKWYFE